MNFFEEGERLKAIFDGLVKQHKKSKRKVVDNKNVSKEILQEYEENRLKLTYFFRMHSKFIRSRKNSVGIFSIDDFVKARTEEAAMVSSKDGVIGEERAVMGFSMGRPVDWNGVSGRGGMSYGTSRGEPFYMQGTIPHGRWRMPMEQGGPMWMGPMGYPITGRQERTPLWGPAGFPRQNGSIEGFPYARPHWMRYRSFNGVYDDHGMWTTPGSRINRQYTGFGVGGECIYDMDGRFPNGYEISRTEERYGMTEKIPMPSSAWGSSRGDERRMNGMGPPIGWIEGNRMYGPYGRREEIPRPGPPHLIFPGYSDYGSGTTPQTYKGGSSAAVCSLYPEIPGKRRCFGQYTQNFTCKDEEIGMARTEIPKADILDETPVSLERSEIYSSNLEDLWRLDIMSEKEETRDVAKKDDSEIAFSKDLLRNGSEGPKGEFSDVNREADSDVETIEDLIERKDIDEEVKEFIYELCDGFVDHIIHMSCALAYHRKKDVVELCDVKLALKTEVGIEVPEDDGDSKDVSSKGKEKR
ncbi:transcription initiation factor TFIID subunit [Encephalitozoon romaleae SJ-2008]|uniref:Transcription initiation factor TFIID subunit n=1 Tax=Encephalitozoon romaleae (strain SJ-2008) TaxID=1178016 RepID=I7ATT4_ENCRO|nr:transcription initiation factor TFIID subunit [Encephalitozoon romaleae SJ-2008]AFN83897.1 transcription initiation factor TFIID subunit [Encephalitozoon romaleae SJ-2008]